MADGLVQKDAGPTGAEHHRHGAGRRGHGGEVHQSLAGRLAAERERSIARDQLGQ